MATVVALGVYGGVVLYKVRKTGRILRGYIYRIGAGDSSPDAALMAAMVAIALNLIILMFAFQEMW